MPPKPSDNPDKRPLPDGWVEEYDGKRNRWYYRQLSPHRISYVHPLGKPPAFAKHLPLNNDNHITPNYSQPHVEASSYGETLYKLATSSAVKTGESSSTRMSASITPSTTRSPSIHSVEELHQSPPPTAFSTSSFASLSSESSSVNTTSSQGSRRSLYTSAQPQAASPLPPHYSSDVKAPITNKVVSPPPPPPPLSRPSQLYEPLNPQPEQEPSIPNYGKPPQVEQTLYSHPPNSAQSSSQLVPTSPSFPLSQMPGEAPQSNFAANHSNGQQPYSPVSHATFSVSQVVSSLPFAPPKPPPYPTSGSGNLGYTPVQYGNTFNSPNPNVNAGPVPTLGHASYYNNGLPAGSSQAAPYPNTAQHSGPKPPFTNIGGIVQNSPHGGSQSAMQYGNSSNGSNTTVNTEQPMSPGGHASSYYNSVAAPSTHVGPSTGTSLTQHNGLNPSSNGGIGQISSSQTSAGYTPVQYTTPNLSHNVQHTINNSQSDSGYIPSQYGVLNSGSVSNKPPANYNSNLAQGVGGYTYVQNVQNQSAFPQISNLSSTYGGSVQPSATVPGPPQSPMSNNANGPLPNTGYTPVQYGGPGAGSTHNFNLNTHVSQPSNNVGYTGLQSGEAASYYGGYIPPSNPVFNCSSQYTNGNPQMGSSTGSAAQYNTDTFAQVGGASSSLQGSSNSSVPQGSNSKPSTGDMLLGALKFGYKVYQEVNNSSSQSNSSSNSNSGVDSNNFNITINSDNSGGEDNDTLNQITNALNNMTMNWDGNGGDSGNQTMQVADINSLGDFGNDSVDVNFNMNFDFSEAGNF